MKFFMSVAIATFAWSSRSLNIRNHLETAPIVTTVTSTSASPTPGSVTTITTTQVNSKQTLEDDGAVQVNEEADDNQENSQQNQQLDEQADSQNEQQVEQKSPNQKSIEAQANGNGVVQNQQGKQKSQVTDVQPKQQELPSEQSQEDTHEPNKIQNQIDANKYVPPPVVNNGKPAFPTQLPNPIYRSIPVYPTPLVPQNVLAQSAVSSTWNV